MADANYETVHIEGGSDIKMWTRGVPVEEEAKAQLEKTAKMPFIFHHLAVMPDVHLGKGSTVGSVIPTLKAVIPAAVGVDIGCSSDIDLLAIPEGGGAEAHLASRSRL